MNFPFYYCFLTLLLRNYAQNDNLDLAFNTIRNHPAWQSLALSITQQSDNLELGSHSQHEYATLNTNIPNPFNCRRMQAGFAAVFMQMICMCATTGIAQ